MKLTHPIFSSLAFSALLGIGGCASIVDGTTQDVKVDSNPSGAEIYVGAKTRKGIVNQHKVGETPMQAVSVPRKDGVIILKKHGYKDVVVTPEREMNGWVWGDIIMLSLLSTSIDTSTGAAKEIDPDEFFVEMEQTAAE